MQFIMYVIEHSSKNVFVAVLCAGTSDTTLSPHVHWKTNLVSQTVLLQENAN